jgi:hypothetical protein
VNLGREQAAAQHSEENVEEDENEIAGIAVREVAVEIAEVRVEGRGGDAADQTEDRDPCADRCREVGDLAGQTLEVSVASGQ